MRMTDETRYRKTLSYKRKMLSFKPLGFHSLHAK